MNGRQKRDNERNIRSDNFLQENKADFAANTVLTAKIAAVHQKVAQTQTKYADQIAGETNVYQDYGEVKDAFDDLVDEMREIREFAREIAKEHDELAELFRMPSGKGKRQYITAARVWEKDAATHKQLFLDYGIEDDFIDSFEIVTDALEETLAEAEASVGERAGATDALGEKVEETSLLVESLNPGVRRAYRNSPAKLREWEYASKVEKHTPKPRDKKKESSEG